METLIWYCLKGKIIGNVVMALARRPKYVNVAMTLTRRQKYGNVAMALTERQNMETLLWH